MKSLKFLRTAPGAALVFAVLATTGASAYALTNWFDGDVTVKQNDSVFSVDLSMCKGNLPPGVDSPDRSNVQFKILGDPHISPAGLQHRLLAQCEYDAVADFYHSQPATKSSSLAPSTIKAIHGDGTLDLQYFWGGSFQVKTFRLTTNATIYNQGLAARLQDMHVDDNIVFAFQLPAYVLEGTDPFANVSEVQSIFKTQYDTAQAPGATKKGFYDDNHIMPLDWYNQIHQ